VSWTLSEDMTAENTIISAWYLARNKRQIKDGFIFHSDTGIQYACHKITSLFCFNSKITQSISRKGNYSDNAVAESF
jgi:transposase InsO family protein